MCFLIINCGIPTVQPVPEKNLQPGHGLFKLSMNLLRLRQKQFCLYSCIILLDECELRRKKKRRWEWGPLAE